MGNRLDMDAVPFGGKFYLFQLGSVHEGDHLHVFRIIHGILPAR